MIKIGITGGILPPNQNRSIFKKKQLCYIEEDFANYWASFGVLPILIPNLKPSYLHTFLDQLDALALMGGTDICPARYREAPIGIWDGDADRDAYEFPILDFCYKKDLPIFGICRGFQLLNTYFGGSLYQDIPTQLKSKTTHADSESYDLNLHKIQLETNELFEELKVCQNSNLVNSIHHQGVKNLAPDLVPLAYSDEGLVEAFYHKKHPKGKVIGVQWHPEFFNRSSETLINDRRITEYFLRFCTKS